MWGVQGNSGNYLKMYRCKPHKLCSLSVLASRQNGVALVAQRMGRCAAGSGRTRQLSFKRLASLKRDVITRLTGQTHSRNGRVILYAHPL